MAAQIIPFPTTERQVLGSVPKRDRRRKLPANAIDLARVQRVLPGDCARDVREVKGTISELFFASVKGELTGLLILKQTARGTFSLSLSGALRYDTAKLLQVVDKIKEVAGLYGDLPIAFRAVNPNALRLVTEGC